MTLKPNSVNVSAPGKIILSGEHAMVYGYPAVLSAIDRRLNLNLCQENDEIKIISDHPPDLAEYGIRQVTKELKVSDRQGWTAKIDSNIPPTGGMGSSAALSVAIAAALYFSTKKKLDLKEINKMAYQIETRQHRRPSGGDNTVSTYGGFLWYRKEVENLKTFSSLTLDNQMKLLIIDSGKPIESTGQMVEKVKSMMLTKPARTDKIFREIEKITRCFLQLLIGEKSYNLANLMNDNEILLEEIGVVSNRAKLLIDKIKSIGGGAKISGAGGYQAGSGIILAYHHDEAKLLNFVSQNMLKYFRVKLGCEGVKLE